MFKKRQKVGKYVIEGKLGAGGFSVVYRALDTVEGVRVALKVPFARHLSEDVLNDFRKEVRLVAQLKHPNILPLKNADFVGEHFLVAFPLGEMSLADRLQYRISSALALNYSEQILKAVSYAHDHKIIHCDIKPENIILFPERLLALTDFGIAKISMRTVQGSGSGTLGHMAPEQAMGKPSYRSDVFSIGLILYRMFSGHWPEYPFEWPFPGQNRLKANLPVDLIELIRKSLQVNPRLRFADAKTMLNAFARVKPRTLRLMESRIAKKRQ